LCTDLKARGSKVSVAKVDATLNPASAKKNHVKEYPTIQFIRDGITVAEYASSARDKKSIIDWISRMSTETLPAQKPKVGATKPSSHGFHDGIVGFVKVDMQIRTTSIEVTIFLS